MERYCCRIAGSRILTDKYKVTWNYRFSDANWAQAQAEFMFAELNEALKDKHVQVCVHLNGCSKGIVGSAWLTFSVQS